MANADGTAQITHPIFGVGSRRHVGRLVDLVREDDATGEKIVDS